MLKNKIKTFLQSDWFIALVLLGMFLATTGYTYGWDDQHLEIPLLKSLIDEDLYKGDYYVESLKKNFSSYFYPLLAKIITVEQVPLAYFILYIISRYFLFFFIYKIWLSICENRFKSFCATTTLITIIRVQEFLYRTFSHQEFTLAIIFAGIYFFFKNRFFLAAILLGIAANFHALYSLYPMLFICFYLLWEHKKHKFSTLILSGLIFTLCCIPFLIWHFKAAFDPSTATVSTDGWIKLYLKACPQNFILSPNISFNIFMAHFFSFIKTIQLYLLLGIFFIFHLVFNEQFRSNKKAVSFALGAFILLAMSFIFTYVHPIRKIVDLNLIRNTQYLLFLLGGFTTIYILNQAEKRKLPFVFILAILFGLFRYNYLATILSLASMTGIFLYKDAGQDEKRQKIQNMLCLIFTSIFLILTFNRINDLSFSPLIVLYLKILLSCICIYFLACLIGEKFKKNIFRWQIFFIIPIAIHFIQFVHYHYNKIQLMKSEDTFWRLQRNWEDMQKAAKKHTPKNAVILAPYDMEMGGFRIGSERKIVASYRDCGIVGFDYSAALEWEQRIMDIQDFKVIQKKDVKNSLKNAIIKYNVNYAVFMKYNTPKNTLYFQEIYSNDIFSLYKIKS